MIAGAFARPSGAADPPRPLPETEVGSLAPERFDFLWLDVGDPTAEDIKYLARTFGFHPLALEDASNQHQRPKVDEYRGGYFVVLYASRADGRRLKTSELQFFWGKGYLVTLHAEPFPEVDELRRRLERGELGPAVGNGERRLDVADVVYRLVDTVVDGYFPVVDVIAELSEDIEEQMFEPRVGSRALEDIFSLKKDLLHLRRVIAPSRDVLNVLLRRDSPIFGPEYVPYFQDVYDHTVRVIDSLDTYRDLLSSGIDIYLSVTSNNVNRAVKTMTAVTAILMVQALIASIYGMNFDFMPELHWTFGYAWALGLMVLAAVVLWGLFRRIRWL